MKNFAYIKISNNENDYFEQKNTIIDYAKEK